MTISRRRVYYMFRFNRNMFVEYCKRRSRCNCCSSSFPRWRIRLGGVFHCAASVAHVNFALNVKGGHYDIYYMDSTEVGWL